VRPDDREADLKTAAARIPAQIRLLMNRFPPIPEIRLKPG
jgi:hypothetical protein